MALQAPTTHDHLYLVPLKHLDLSDKLNRLLKKVSITSVGDCIEFFIQDRINAYPSDRADYMDEMLELAKTARQVPFFIFMYTEVRQILQEHGYWSFVEQADIQHTLERRAARKRLIQKQQAKHQHLYEMPLRGFGLSDKTLTILQQVSITSIGDCIKFFTQTRDDYPADSAVYREKLSEMARTITQVPFFVFMFLEVEPMLRERGYWSFVEEGNRISDTTRAYSPKPAEYQSSKHEHLYRVPLEYLGLSNEVFGGLKRSGISSVGDCVVLYHRAKNTRGVMDGISPQLALIMEGELKQKLKTQGYWSFIEEDLT